MHDAQRTRTVATRLVDDVAEAPREWGDAVLRKSSLRERAWACTQNSAKMTTRRARRGAIISQQRHEVRARVIHQI